MGFQTNSRENPFTFIICKTKSNCCGGNLITTTKIKVMMTTNKSKIYSLNEIIKIKKINKGLKLEVTIDDY